MFDQIFGTFSDATLYFIMGAVATSLFLIRMVLTLMGFGGDHGGDFSVDVTGDTDFSGAHDHGHTDAASTFKLLSVLSVMAFFMGAGWMGLASRLDWELDPFGSFLAAVIFGTFCMFLASGLMFMMRKLNSEPKMNLAACVGGMGQAYLNIPEKGQGLGKVKVEVQGQNRILTAQSAGPAIPAFTRIKVLKVEGDSSVVVEAAG